MSKAPPLTLADLDMLWIRAIHAAVDAGLADSEYTPITDAIGALHRAASCLKPHAAIYAAAPDRYVENYQDMLGGLYDLAISLCCQVEALAEEERARNTPGARAWAAAELGRAIERENRP